MCGCLKNKSKTARTSPSSKDSVCGHQLDDLNALEKVIIAIIRDKVNDSILFNANKQLRYWIVNLDKECPNYYELNVIKDYIDNEYSEYTT